MSKKTFRDMMVKFERIEQLGILPKRGIKTINNAASEEVSSAVVEASSEELH